MNSILSFFNKGARKTGDMNREMLLTDWRREEQQPFEGWDFSYLEGRMLEDEEPWSYMDRAAELMAGASSAVDLDTGGGERLLQLRPHWPARLVATEEYPPNLSLARQRLEPLGVQVVPVHLTDDDPMPFGDGEFDVILNRHGAFNPAEIARCLAPGGTFLTQQVHGLAEWDLVAAFDATAEYIDATPEKYLPRLQAAGLTLVDLREWQGQLRFTDVGAIVYYLKATPWTVPDFSVESHSRYLFALQERLERGEELSFVWWLYLIEAKKR
jgi:SAM-dependent methyltransferase